MAALKWVQGARPRTAWGMMRGRAVDPGAAEVGGEAGGTDGPVQVDLAQDGGDAAIPPVLLDRRLLRVHPGAGERRPFRRLDLAFRLQLLLEALDQKHRRYIVCGRHQEHASVRAS